MLTGSNPILSFFSQLPILSLPPSMQTVEAKVQHDAIMNQGYQAVADSRAAAAAIKNRMRGGDNVLTWQ